MNMDETNVEQITKNEQQVSTTTSEQEASIENQVVEKQIETKEVEKKAPEEIQETKEVKPVAASTKETATEKEPKKVNTPSPSNRSSNNEIFAELKQKRESMESIEVLVKSRIKGGFRVVYQDMPMFLPISHFSLKKTPPEAELQDAVGTKQIVLVHELQEFDGGRKAVIVTKKPLLRQKFYSNLKKGDKVKGIVSSIAPFGVFVDLGGIEGLIHISRLAQIRVEDPSSIVKKGQEIEAIISKIDEENDKIGLSRKELLESPWKGIAEEFSPGTQHKGIVRRLTDFGAYIELKPGVDGLLRTPEISWTKRIKKPASVFSQDQEITVEVLNVSEEKQTVALSVKKTLPNPWPEMKEKYPIKSEVKGIVSQVMPQGIIATINDEVDGFMPRSKMRDILRGKKIPFQVNDEIDVVIADLVPEEESLILAPVIDESMIEAARQRKSSRSRKGSQDTSKAQAGITLLDLISDSEKKNLIESMNQ